MTLIGGNLGDSRGSREFRVSSEPGCREGLGFRVSTCRYSGGLCMRLAVTAPGRSECNKPKTLNPTPPLIFRLPYLKAGSNSVPFHRLLSFELVCFADLKP